MTSLTDSEAAAWRIYDGDARWLAEQRRDYPEGPTEAVAPAVLYGDAEWTADLEHVWRVGVAAARGRWETRAREQRRAGDRRRAAYAAARARGLGLARADRVASCGGRWRTVACACGHATVPVGCDQTQLCRVCSRRLWGAWRKRMTRGLRDALAREVEAWARRGARGKRPMLYLLTLTVPHSGSIVDDRRRLGEGWRRLYKRAKARGWWTSYAGAYEVTPGRDALGHVHLHMVLVSRWIPYEELHEAWRDATPWLGDGPRVLDISTRINRGKPDERRVSDADAASYVSKYVTKSTHPGEFSGQKAGELLVAFAGKRKVTTSVGFWRPVKRCDTCASRFRLVQMPPGLARHAPGPCWSALARHTRRGQRLLDLGPDPPRERRDAVGHVIR